MTITVTPAVKIGTAASPTDFTSRTAGVQVSQRLELMAPSTGTALITLHNHDGELTPAAAGGTGTYAAVDWFAQGVFIEATVNGTDTAALFHGLVTDFDMTTDAATSTVTITAVDPLSIAGRGPTEFPGSAGTDTINDAIENVLADMSGYTVPVLPTLGGSAVDQTVLHVTDNYRPAGFPPIIGPLVDTSRLFVNPQTIADALRNQVMPSALSLLWSDRITSTAGTTTYRANVAGPALARITQTGADAYATARVFEFTPAAAGTELTATKLDVGYRDAGRINWATLTTVAASGTAEAINTASVETYGAQAFTATTTINNNVNTYTTAGSTYVGADSSAQTLANRFGSRTWAPHRITTTTAALAGLADTASPTVAALLDCTAGLWQRADITYTPAGGTSTTAQTVITGRTITATPGRMTITLDVAPAAELQPFTLDSDALGVLDTNRLGI